MSIFDDIGHAFESAGKTVVHGVTDAATTVGTGIETAAKTGYYSAKMSGEAVANLVTHPDEVFSSVNHEEVSHASPATSAVPVGGGVLEELDLVFAVTEAELSTAIAARWQAGQLPFAQGAIQLGGPSPELFSLVGEWGAPALEVLASAQPGSAHLNVPVEHAQLSWISEPWPPFTRESIEAQTVALGFQVALDLVAVERDALKQDATVPSVVRHALDGHTDLSINRLLVDFQNSRLATLTHVEAGTRLTAMQASTVRGVLLAHFKSLGPDQGVLGYAVTSDDARPGGQGMLRPSAVKFSTSLNSARSTLNYLMMTGGRKFGGEAAYAGGFSRALLPAGLRAGMVVASRLFTGELVEKQILARVANAVGHGAGFKWDPANRRWNLSWDRVYSGMTVVSGDVNSLYADGNEASSASASISTPGGRALVVRVSGTSHWQETLWQRPMGNRQTIGTMTADCSWSLSVTVRVLDDGQLEVEAPPPSVSTTQSEHKGDAGRLLSMYTNALNDFMSAVTSQKTRLMGLSVLDAGETIRDGLASAAAGIVFPGAGQLTFDSVRLDTDMNLVVGAHYSPAPPAADVPAVSSLGPTPGGSGAPFDDYPAVQEHGRMHRLVITHGDILGSIAATTGERVLAVHGGGGGALETIEIDPDDPIVEITGVYGQWYGATHIAALRLRTRSGHWYGPYGSSRFMRDKAPFAWLVPHEANHHISAFHGRVRTHTGGDSYISALGVTVVEDGLD